MFTFCALSLVSHRWGRVAAGKSMTRGFQMAHLQIAGAEVSNRHCFEKGPAPCALVLLNTPSSFEALTRVWGVCNFRIAADGASSRLYRTLMSAGSSDTSLSISNDGVGARDDTPAVERYIPDMICGDWDSIDRDTEDFYRSRGVPVLPDPDQDTTDLMKCLARLDERQQKGLADAGCGDGSACSSQFTRYRVIVYGAFGGRFDQEMQNLNTLYTWSSKFESMTMLSEDCLACLLPAGTSRVRVAWPWEGPTCGLIPLGRPVTALTTSGLHWDVKDWDTKFGGHISTSNRVEGYPLVAAASNPAAATAGSGSEPSPESGLIVTVTSSDPIIWTASVNLHAKAA